MAPLPAGWVEVCTLADPTHNGKAWPNNHLIEYNPTAVGTDPNKWAYVVAHERCHAAYVTTPHFSNEPLMDTCAIGYGTHPRHNRKAY